MCERNTIAEKWHDKAQQWQSGRSVSNMDKYGQIWMMKFGLYDLHKSNIQHGPRIPDLIPPDLQYNPDLRRILFFPPFALSYTSFVPCCKEILKKHPRFCFKFCTGRITKVKGSTTLMIGHFSRLRMRRGNLGLNFRSLAKSAKRCSSVSRNCLCLVFLPLILGTLYMFFFVEKSWMWFPHSVAAFVNDSTSKNDTEVRKCRAGSMV